MCAIVHEVAKLGPPCCRNQGVYALIRVRHSSGTCNAALAAIDGTYKVEQRCKPWLEMKDEIDEKQHRNEWANDDNALSLRYDSNTQCTRGTADRRQAVTRVVT